MARVRPATERVWSLGANVVERALGASAKAGNNAAFYRVVGMRNPSRSYFIQWERRLHSLKAVATYALRDNGPGTISRDFHAVDAARRISELGFTVVHEAAAAERERERVWLSRLARPRQAKFRERVVDLYGRCALTGCSTLAVLEAAHIVQVKDRGLDIASNGILLRVDLHKLFDGNYLAIDPADGRVALASQCQFDYAALFTDVRFVAPPGGPSLQAFRRRWEEFNRAIAA